MSPYDSIRRWSLALGFACGVAVDNALNRYAVTHIDTYVVGFVLDLVAISLTTFAVQRVVQLAFGKSETIRRFLLQKEFIEGVWADMIIQDKKVTAFGLVRFEPTSESLRYLGENYAIDGCYVSSFASEMVYIDWPFVKFKYRGVDRSSEHIFPEGFGELQFVTGSRLPERFTGYSVNVPKGQKAIITGWRLDNARLRKLEESAEARKVLFEEYLRTEGR